MDKNARTSVKEDIRREGAEKSDFSRVTELLLNNDFKRRKTILNPRVITIVATLDVISQLYDIDFLKTWLENYSEWLTSSGGKGRQDIVDISKFHYAQLQDQNKELLNLLGRR